MEMVSYIANEPWSDHPECVCPVLTKYAIRINDRSDDETRQKLKGLITKLVGTRSNEATEKTRAEFFTYWAVTVTLPLLTDALDLPEVSTKLRSFQYGDWKEMQSYCYDIRSTVREAAKKHRAATYAADAAAYTADAAANAAADAAYAAAYAADAAYTAAAYAAHYAVNTAAATKTKKFWTRVGNDIWSKAIEGLSLACEISITE
jgi:hypothetical protein